MSLARLVGFAKDVLVPVRGTGNTALRHVMLGCRGIGGAGANQPFFIGIARCEALLGLHGALAAWSCTHAQGRQDIVYPAAYPTCTGGMYVWI